MTARVLAFAETDGRKCARYARWIENNLEWAFFFLLCALAFPNVTLWVFQKVERHIK